MRLILLSRRIQTSWLSTSSSHTSDSVPLAFRKYGSSNDTRTPPLLIAHGLFGNKQNWNSVAKALQQKLGNQVIVLLQVFWCPDLCNWSSKSWRKSLDDRYDIQAYGVWYECIYRKYNSRQCSAFHINRQCSRTFDGRKSCNCDGTRMQIATDQSANYRRYCAKILHDEHAFTFSHLYSGVRIIIIVVLSELRCTFRRWSMQMSSRLSMWILPKLVVVPMNL